MPCCWENNGRTSSLTWWQRCWLYRHQYSVVAFLGQGAYGEVFKCRLSSNHPFMRVFLHAREEEARIARAKTRKSSFHSLRGSMRSLRSVRSLMSFLSVAKLDSTLAIPEVKMAPEPSVTRDGGKSLCEILPVESHSIPNTSKSSVQAPIGSHSGHKTLSGSRSVGAKSVSKSRNGESLVFPRGMTSFQRESSRISSSSDAQRQRNSLKSYASFASAASSTAAGGAVDTTGIVQFISDELCKVMSLKQVQICHVLSVDDLRTVEKRIHKKTMMLSATVGPVSGGSVLCAGEDIIGDTPEELMRSLHRNIRHILRTTTSCIPEEGSDVTQPATVRRTCWLEFINGDDEAGGHHLTSNLKGKTRGFANITYLAKTISNMSRPMYGDCNVHVAIKICPLRDTKQADVVDFQIRALSMQLKHDKAAAPQLRKKQGILRRHRDQFGKMSSESLLREVMVLQRCEHPNVVRVFEYFKCTHFLYVAFQLCFGSLLDATVSRYGMGDGHYLLRPLMGNIVAALMWIHDKQIVHRDIKPGNILFTDPSCTEVVVADFGLACLQSEVGSTICGSPAYLAPEVWLDNMFTSASDMWAVGLTFFFLLTGEQWMSMSSSFAALRRVKGDQGVGWNGSFIPKFREPALSKMALSICESVQDSECAKMSWAHQAEIGDPRENSLHVLDQLLFRDPAFRLTAPDFLRDDWFDE